MMRRPLRRAWLFLVLSAGSATAATIENPLLRLTVADDTGAITSLYHRTTGVEFIEDRSRAGLFELQIPDASNLSRRIDSRQQRASVQAGTDRIDIDFKGLKPVEDQVRFGSGVMHFPQDMLAIDVHITLRLEGEHIAASMTTNNGSRVPITGVVFPYVAGLASRQAGRNAEVWLPSAGQRRFQHSLSALTGERTQRYPALLAATWLNLQYMPATADAGVAFAPVSLAIEARSGLEVQDAYFALNPGPFGPGSAYLAPQDFPFIAWIHYPHLAPGAQWTSAAMLLHPHASDWHRVAAEHREWYRAVHHPRSSDGWDHESGFASYGLKDDQNTIRWKYVELPDLLEAARGAGFRRIVIDGWRAREGPGNPAPFGEIADDRLGGAPGLGAAVKSARKGGGRLIFAYHPTLLNPVDGRMPPELDTWAVRTRRHGHQLPVDFLMATDDYPDAIDGASYRAEIDPSSPASAFFIRDVSRLAHQYGFDALLLRGVGQQAFLSYFSDREPAPQRAFPDGYSRLLSGIRRALPGSLLLSEGFNDLVNPLVDGAYLWDQSHDGEVLSYSLPWQKFSHDVEALEYAGANRAFAQGMLINLIVDGGSGTVRRYPAFAAHLAALQRLKAAALGARGTEFRDHDGELAVQGPSTLAWGNFEDASGARHVTVVANLCDCAARAGIHWRLTPRAAQLHRLNGSRHILGPANAQDLELDAYEVILLAFDSPAAAR
ncbi:MAG: hypothetical protein U1F35_06155 [Steroidobacteraceae bacterium]